MKRFSRTMGGKAVLFVLCITMLVVLTASVIGAAYMIEKGYYTKNEDELYGFMIERSLANKGRDILTLASVSGTEPVIITDCSLALLFVDDEGQTIAKTKDSDNIETWPYAAVFLVRRGSKESESKYKEYFFWYGYQEEMGTEIYEFVDPEKQLVGFTLRAAISENNDKQDVFRALRTVSHVTYQLRYATYAIGITALFLAIFCFVSLMCAAGRRNDTEELVPGFMHGIPYDLLLAAVAGILWFVMYHVMREVTYIGRLGSSGDGFIMGAAFLLTANVLLGFAMSTAVRIKSRTLFTNTVIYRILVLIGKGIEVLWKGVRRLFCFIGSMVKSLPLVVKTIIVIAGLSVIEFFAIIITLNSHSDDGVLILWLIEKIILVPLILYAAIMLKKLQKSGEALAAGNLNYQTDLRGMRGDFKRHGEDLNQIAEGMTLAVEEQLKSERMKTALITNVSHDIRTPLTSVINYTDLLSREETDNEKIREYTSVLKRQSDRLKRLIDDLVEASKASSGAMEIIPEPLDLVVLLSQAAGEYEEKLKMQGLEPVITCQEERVMIMADGRRLWRIIDNLMNNICKYAMEHTRVYLDLKTENGQAVITFRNVSRDPLNISEEELMERFTRGDDSRHTEGSGLGLSIAKSLAELMKGSLRVFIDGDLFKAVLTFPVLKTN